jgi:PAS domain S-box-containing protein
MRDAKMQFARHLLPSTTPMHQLSSSDRYRLFAQSANEHAIIITDVEGRIMEWSAGAEKLLGWSAAQAIGQPVLMIYTQEDRDSGAAEAELSGAKQYGCSSDVRLHLRRDGSTVFCDGIVNQVFADDTTTVVGYGKIMRAAAVAAPDHHAPGGAEQRSFVAALIESVDAGIVVCDRQGRVTFFNQVARDIHEMDAHPLPFEQWARHYHLYRPDGVTLLPCDEVPLYRALHGDTVDNANIVVKTPAGTMRHVRVAGRPVLDGNGQVLGAVISMHDVTALTAAVIASSRAEDERQRRLAAEQSEARLRKAKEQLNLATDAAQLGIWTWDARGTGTWENPRMFDIFNVPSQQANLRNAYLGAFLVSQDLERFEHGLRATVDSGSPLHFTGQFRRLGEPVPRWLELTGVRHTLADSGAVTVIGTAADITARRSSEDALKAATLRFEATLSAAEVASWIWDIEHDSVVADRNLTKLFGVADELAPSAPLALYAQAIHPDDRDRVTAEIEHAIATRAFFSAAYRVKGADGVYRSIIARGRVMYNDAGQAEVLAGVTVDITRQTEAQTALREAQERYRTLLSSMDEAFAVVQVVVDAHGVPADYRFEEANDAFRVQSGLIDAAGRTIRELVPDIEPHWIAIYGKVALTRQPERFIEHSAAMGYWWDVYAAPIGEPQELRIAIIFTDITARKKAEDDLRQVAADLSEANRRKTEFLATLAHELRNPLAPVRSGLDLLQSPASSPESKQRVLAIMDRQLKHMVHLIDDLMEISRINSGKIVLQRAPTDLASVVAQAVDATRPALEAAHHYLEVCLPAAPVVLDVDATRTVQILANLLTNAIKYTPAGGRITITAALDADLVGIAVQDNGIGIPEADLERIFDMFGQVAASHGYAQGGLGIGLALVRSLVEMHGGRIAVTSPGLNAGATFTAWLPAYRQPVPVDSEPDSGQAARAAAADRLSILIADDNEDAADLLSTLLQLDGHDTYVVHDGVDAVKSIAAILPDLALVDIGMPGLNGYEVAQRIRNMPGTRHVMLAALTGWGGEADRQRARDAGFDSHLTKPVVLEEIQRMINRCISDSSAVPGRT